MRAIASGKGWTLVVVLAIVVVAGCNSASTATGGPAGSSGASSPVASAASPETAAPASEPAAPSESAAAPEPSLASAVPTAVDPCQLVTKEEASTLAGTTFGAGKEQTLGQTKECVFGSPANSFHVAVIQAPDTATAQAAKKEFEQQVQKSAPPGLKFTEIPGLADGAATAEFSTKISGQEISGSAIYVLKGTIAFGITDIVVGGSAPGTADLEALARTVLGRLP